jgi:hypothetical protein
MSAKEAASAIRDALKFSGHLLEYPFFAKYTKWELFLIRLFLWLGKPSMAQVVILKTVDDERRRKCKPNKWTYYEIELDQ